MKHTVTVFRGDGIGPELVDNVLKILEAAKAPLEYEIYNVGEDEWKRNGALIPDEAYASFERTKVLLKSPITTPVGKGFRSLNVTLRGKYDLYANIRPVKSNDAVKTPFKNVDIVIFRENTEVCMSEKKNRSMRTRFTRSRSLPRKHLSASSATPSSTRRRTVERKLPAFTRQTSSRCLTACSSRSSVKLQRITRKSRLMTRSSTTPACSSS